MSCAINCFSKNRLISSTSAASALAVVLAISGSIGPVFASDRPLRPRAGIACDEFVLSCENGRDYPFCPQAVSELGDVVTGTLMTGQGRGVSMRLIPMGTGYRYAGRGIWFDGYRGAAALNFGKRQSLACTVTGSVP